MQQIKYIIKYLLSLISEPEQTWQYLSVGDVDESKPDYVHSNYYLPLMGVIAVGIFLLSGLGLEFSIEKAMKAIVRFLSSYFAGPYFAVLILRILTKRWFSLELEEYKLQVFVYYSMSFLMLIQLFAAAFPNCRFSSISSLYLFYIIWCSADFFKDVMEHYRWKFSTVCFFVIWAAPRIIEYLISFMIR